MYKFIFLFIGSILLSSSLYGQKCGTPSPDLNDPFNRWFNDNVQPVDQARAGGHRIIPVVVHVIFRELNDPHNITLAQIESQFPVLNTDFRGLSGGVDTEVEFCLAGVRRLQKPNGYIVTKGVNDQSVKLSSQAPPKDFLNVWIVDQIIDAQGANVLGYASKPKDLTLAPQEDGVVIADDYWGTLGTVNPISNYGSGRTATHEIGHYLNLFHTHEGGCDNKWNCGYIGDCCCDTPPQDFYYFGCKQNLNSCSTDDPNLKDPIHNYMSYSDDACMHEFTMCQAARIKLTLDSVRTDLWFLSGDCPVYKSQDLILSSPIPTVSLFPNPSNGATTLEFTLNENTLVDLEIWDANGRKLFSPLQGVSFSAQTHKYTLDYQLAQGIYFVKMKIGDFSTVHKWVVID